MARRVITIGVSLMALNQFCGCFAIISYTATLFEQSGSSLSPNVSTIIVGILLLVGAYVSTVLVDRAGRRVCLGNFFNLHILSPFLLLVAVVTVRRGNGSRGSLLGAVSLL